MSENPEMALRALNASPVTVCGFEVRPVTLRMCCVLDEIGSPLVTGERAQRLGAWAGTLYAMTRDAAESQRLLASGRGAFDDAAMAWADGVPMAAAFSLIRACLAQAAAAAGVNPEAEDGGDQGEASAATAG